MLVDESASATVRQLGDALTELEVNGHFFGDCSLSLVLFSEDARTLERSAAEAIKVMASHDGSVHRRDLQPPERLARASSPATARTTSVACRCSKRTTPT